MCKEEDRSNYVTITHGMRGYFAVMLWWNPDGFWEPWNTGSGSYKTEQEAIPEAKDWAKAEEVRYIEPN